MADLGGIRDAGERFTFVVAEMSCSLDSRRKESTFVQCEI
jgi:hypothetical protein